MRQTLREVSDTHRFAAALVKSSPGGGGRVALEGDLGTGKTELVRGCLRSMGETGPVKSPTYTLVEQYSPPGYRVKHLDLYRLLPGEDMNDLGFRELGEGDWCFVEWPDRLQIPFRFDLKVTLSVRGDERMALLQPGSPKGEKWLDQLSLNLK